MIATSPLLGDAALRLLTINEVVALTGNGRSFIYSEIRAGRLRSVRLGRNRRVRAADLAAYVDSVAEAS